ncbi:uncharacterized protein BNAC08G28910D isoform X1 [Brassica napus]|uniref:uncharacterized protein BNAC08G28910D isoform X1 n=1 Tax=Brassica napus TaxID=3708 RepID=UPI0006AA75AB|nr:uncharacterized protein BNAC08G28910D isoform X1 [Brassica napus]
MAKPENNENHQTWSTWEELLLACAVHRHGIDSWDSVAAEIHKQNSSSRALTASDCRHKYHDLERRFSPGGDTVSEISGWLEELRKLRVDELRREVERYDLSISSLQMKVKRLEDEREKSLKEEAEKVTESPDLVKITETVNNSDVPVIEPNREIDESIEEKPNRIGGDETDEKPVREDSGRGSCESVAKDSERGDSVREGKDSPELKLEEEVKETSDVQSSASLPRKEKPVGHDQPDNEDQSLAVNKTLVKSRPLIEFIEMLCSHPIGSHFSRRLESQLQETPEEYERIIRQHIDFDLIRTRVEEGYYESSKTKFHRDLLVLINNAKVFYGERSPDSNSATQLHELIKKQMTTLNTSNQTSPTKDEPLVTSKEEELTLLSLKTEVSVSVKACRKRSSLAVRSSEPFKKKTNIVPTTDENEKKQVSETEEEDETTTDKDEEPIVPKKTPRGRTTTTSSSAKKIGTRNVVKTSLDDDQKKSDQEKKGKTTANAVSKKQSAASFLKRMKGAETVLETVKDDSSSGKKGAEQRRSNTKHEKAVAGQKRTTPAKKNTSAASKREASEKEEGSSTRPKKRTRKL